MIDSFSKEVGEVLSELRWHFARDYKYSYLSSAYEELVCVAVLQNYKLYQLKGFEGPISHKNHFGCQEQWDYLE